MIPKLGKRESLIVLEITKLSNEMHRETHVNGGQTIEFVGDASFKLAEKLRPIYEKRFNVVSYRIYHATLNYIKLIQHGQYIQRTYDFSGSIPEITFTPTTELQPDTVKYIYIDTELNIIPPPVLPQTKIPQKQQSEFDIL